MFDIIIFMNLILLVAGIFILIGLYSLANILVNNIREKILPYKAKKYFFSKSEQEFFEILIEKIDPKKYQIFPKVRLADFMEVTVYGREYYKWFNKIKSKHVDFMIWDLEKKEIAFVIELDGSSHNKMKVIKRDDFINELYERVGIKIERIKVGDNFEEAINKIFLTM